MNFNSGVDNPLFPMLKGSLVLFIFLFVLLLHALGISLLPLLLLLATGAALWTAFLYPTTCLGAFLGFIPIFPMAAMIAEYFGPSYLTLAPAMSRVVLLLLVFALWRQNGITLTATDWILILCFLLALVRLAFGGLLVGLLTDFNFLIAYAAGRVVALTASQQRLWAGRGMWIIAVLSIVGLSEIFIFGPGPRTLLYLRVLETSTTGGGLDPTFRADQFEGIREAATMPGPGGLASLCMIALIIWWVYRKNVVPAVMIAIGLICTLTRSAWLGTAISLPLLAVLQRQGKRIFVYVAMALVLFILAIPFLGIGDFIFLSKSGQDLSALGHQESVFAGLEYLLNHLMGAGPGNAGLYGTANNSNGVFFESSYLTFAATYGLPITLCFFAFLLSAFRVAWRLRSDVGYVAIGTLTGFAVVMAVAPQLELFPLACWVWFPVGLAVRASS
jgi:hypothetical protein